MTEKLKPCPFCGGEAESYMESFHQPSGVETEICIISCKNCGVEFNHYTEAEYVIELWNTRIENESDQLKRDLQAQIEYGEILAKRLKATQNLLAITRRQLNAKKSII